MLAGNFGNKGKRRKRRNTKKRKIRTREATQEIKKVEIQIYSNLWHPGALGGDHHMLCSNSPHLKISVAKSPSALKVPGVVNTLNRGSCRNV